MFVVRICIWQKSYNFSFAAKKFPPTRFRDKIQHFWRVGGTFFSTCQFGNDQLMNSQDTVVNVIINNILTCSKVATDVQIRFLVQTSVLHLKSTAAAAHRVARGGVTAISDNRVNATARNLCQWRFCCLNFRDVLWLHMQVFQGHRVAWGGVTAISDNRVNTNTTACNLCQWRLLP